MLRGDYKSAHAALVAAQRKDPTNKFVQNNLRLLEVSYRKGKSVEQSLTNATTRVGHGLNPAISCY
jgi:Flp pilus assembly protein TadD